MQVPTCTGIRIRSLSDAHVIFHAVTLGLLPIVSRRLDIEERRYIHSGCVCVWEERSACGEASSVCLHLLLPPRIAPSHAFLLLHLCAFPSKTSLASRSTPDLNSLQA